MVRIWGTARHDEALPFEYMKKFFSHNGLTLVLLACFAASLYGHSAAGHLAYNQEQRAHGEPEIAYLEYLTDGQFIETVFENWESEFLQLAVFVIFTCHLRQKGAKQSKPFGKPHPSDEDPKKHMADRLAPWPVRKGGLALLLYEHSLGLSMFLLFILSFMLHAVGGTMDYNEEQLQHGEAPVSILEYLGEARFWFESLQNWQSEFLAVAVMVVFSIFLRQHASPESKPVHVPHSHTGD
jgi:hypothetical protein